LNEQDGLDELGIPAKTTPLCVCGGPLMVKLASVGREG